MADAELEEIRRARLAQLQQQGGARGGSSDGNQEEQRRHDSQTQAEADRRTTILNQILEPEAADRLGRIRLVKESRAADVESRLIMLAQSGQLRQKVTEEQLKQLLNAMAENQRKDEEEHKIVINRRGGWDDDDDLLDL
ncbi:programmed cell death protein 5 [Aspergillus tubingensis]|uniref:Programmed cell death protein 5 n=1 Tax=Aspergillus tubingensis TaxID=5068 RepID=A0A8H3SY06_ASPTU|nr:dsDNA-binding protein PDCD5 [Aspergillus tubingensis]GFN17371.1 dsDNA-binding protein PDCD5 [Aspergillus tubingensis]GLA64182.1 programmed cell death protein 5 [Aspergillus tubingensis]GLA76737.1 programmed cell death protein 5 [Aspergillus tubingensis]GLA80992.1 programmed cell death protein 5 [Aspergillus tubingensis]GLA99897.1 programmed cell death protein 5 [Aspergillus tubingensis]